jgi:hypothetical protein
VLDTYAPDLAIGWFVTSEAHQRYKLRDAAYVGYRDPSFTGPDGVRGLLVYVTSAPGDGTDDRVPWHARVTSVQLDLPDAASAHRVDRRIRTALGPPRVSCHRYAPGERVEIRWWSGTYRNGIRLELLREGGPRDAAVGTGYVSFGADQFLFPSITEPC